MRSVRLSACILFAGVAVAAGLSPDAAQARCKMWTATHNGTDLFYPNEGGAAGTAANKLRWQVEEWRREQGIKKVRIGKIRTSCGEWFVKYLIPHKNCVAKANVCY